MNELRERAYRRDRIIVIALALVAGIAGAYLAYSTADRYPALANGAVSIAAAYLFYMNNFITKRAGDVSDSMPLKLPGGLKQVWLTFICSLIGVWAGIQVVHMIWWLSAAIRAIV